MYILPVHVVRTLFQGYFLHLLRLKILYMFLLLFVEQKIFNHEKY